MSDRSDGDIGAFLAGFVIGGLVGAATALVLAPQSGTETRAYLQTKGEELKRTGEERFSEYKEKADVFVHDAASQVQERARIVLDEGKTKIGGVIEKGKEKIAGAAETLEPGEGAEQGA